MRLDEQIRCRDFGDCGVGLRAGISATMWPLDLIWDGKMWLWQVYIMPYDRTRTGSRRRIETCPKHFDMLAKQWEQQAQEEVDLEWAWGQYCERMEP